MTVFEKDDGAFPGQGERAVFNGLVSSCSLTRS